MNEERFFSVTTDYNGWADNILEQMEVMNNTLPGPAHKPIWLACFKSCDFYLTKPVGICEHKMITAKSRQVEDDQEVIDFVKENPKKVVPYMYFVSGERKIFRFAEIGETLK